MRKERQPFVQCCRTKGARMQPKTFNKLASLYRSRRNTVFFVEEFDRERKVDNARYISTQQTMYAMKLVRKTNTRVVTKHVSAEATRKQSTDTVTPMPFFLSEEGLVRALIHKL